MDERRRVLFDLVEEDRPTSIRHAYYRASVLALVPKTDAGYGMVQRALAAMRRDETIPYSWISDSTRWMRKPRTHDSLADALADTARFYRRNLWANAGELIEVWCESDSVAGVVTDVTHKWDVPLFPCRGFSSITFAADAAQMWNEDGRPRVVIYVGDHDGAGLAIEKNLRKELATHARVPFTFERLGVTWEQVEALDLPGTEPKKAKKTGKVLYDYPYPIAVEAEALPAPMLRQMLEERIAANADARELELLEIAEESERELLYDIARGVTS